MGPQEDVQDDGFIKVTSKSQNRRQRPCRSKGNHDGSNSKETEATFNETDLQELYDKIKMAWTRDDCYPRVKAILEISCGIKLCNQIKKFIILGLGSLSSNHRAAETSMWQLVIGLHTKDLLAEFNISRSIDVYAQDPIFNFIDETFLRSHGIKVVNDPAAFSQIDESAFVYAPHFGYLSWPGFVPDARIPLLLGNDLSKDFIQKPSLITENYTTEMNIFLKRREKLKWPEPRFPFVLNDIILYWLKESEDSDD